MTNSELQNDRSSLTSPQDVLLFLIAGEWEVVILEMVGVGDKFSTIYKVALLNCEPGRAAAAGGLRLITC